MLSKLIKINADINELINEVSVVRVRTMDVAVQVDLNGDGHGLRTGRVDAEHGTVGGHEQVAVAECDGRWKSCY